MHISCCKAYEQSYHKLSQVSLSFKIAAVIEYTPSSIVQISNGKSSCLSSQDGDKQLICIWNSPKQPSFSGSTRFPFSSNGFTVLSTANDLFYGKPLKIRRVMFVENRWCVSAFQNSSKSVSLCLQIVQVYDIIIYSRLVKKGCEMLNFMQEAWHNHMWQEAARLNHISNWYH